MPNTKAKPFTRPNSVAEYIDWQIRLCGKSQKQIAEEAGFPKPNIITMFKKGDTKLPMEKIGRFAKAIEVDPLYLYKLCMQEYYPDTWNEIARLVGQPPLTANEIEIVEFIRTCDVINPKLRTDAEKAKIAEAINSLKTDNETN